MAERVGFEPTVRCRITSFQDWLLKPLGHLSRWDKLYHFFPALSTKNHLFGKVTEMLHDRKTRTPFLEPWLESSCFFACLLDREQFIVWNLFLIFIGLTFCSTLAAHSLVIGSRVNNVAFFCYRCVMNGFLPRFYVISGITVMHIKSVHSN